MAKKYRIDADLKLAGVFWPPSHPDEKTAGSISSESERIEFLHAPSFAKLDSETMRKAFRRIGTMPEASESESLCGFTKEGPCTLLDLDFIGDDGTTDFSRGHAITANRFRVGAMIMGLHLESWKSDAIDGAAFYFTDIHSWLPTPFGMEMKDEATTYTAPHRAKRVFEFSSESLGAVVTCEVFAGGGVKFRESARIKSVARLRIQPIAPKSLEWFIDLSIRAENFFSLFLGTSVALKRLQIFQGDTDAWLIRRIRKSRQKTNLQLWVNCPADQVGNALAKWLTSGEDRRPVETTLLGVIRKSSLFVETEFLGLAQAMEAFGRIRFDDPLIPASDYKRGLVKLREAINDAFGKDTEIAKKCSDSLINANEPSYRSRIEKACSILNSEFAEKLIGDISQFATRVAQTRNFYTHLGIKRGGSVVEDPKSLFLLNQRLHSLLRCLVLLELGIEQALIQQPILYQASRWF